MSYIEADAIQPFCAQRTGETSFGSYDVYWMPINDGLISNSTDPSRPTANVANGEPDRDVYASKFDTDLGNDSRVSPS